MSHEEKPAHQQKPQFEVEETILLHLSGSLVQSGELEVSDVMEKRIKSFEIWDDSRYHELTSQHKENESHNFL